jgi:ribose transport system substrate-binding protein
MRGGLLAGLAAGGLLLAGCGGDDASTTATAGARGANVEAAQALVDKYSAEPEFTPPGPPIDAVAGMKGKKVMEIPVTSQVPLTQVISAELTKQAKRIGFGLKVWENQGKPDQWVQGIEAAIAQRYDVVDLLGIDPKLVAPQIKKARAAGVKVLSSHLAGFGWDVPDTIDGAVRLPYHEVGQLLAAWAITQTDGKANVLAIVAEDLASTADVVKGIRDEFARDCPDCKVTTRNVVTTQWATGVQKEVTNGIRRDPNVNYVLPIYDAMTQFAAAGLKVAGKGSSIGMASFNGTPFALKMVADGDLAMNIGENEVWIGRAILDAAMRAAMDEPVPDDDYKGAPLLVFTKDNVAQAGSPPDPAKGYGDAYEAGFDQLWGLDQ